MKFRRLRIWKRWVGKMPADALFEVMAVATAVRRRMALAMPAGPNATALDCGLGGKQVSTTDFESFVVENGPEKLPLKVLVESLLLAFYMKCRRADIFHRIAVAGSNRRRILRFSSQKSPSDCVAEPSMRVDGRPQKAIPTFGTIQTSTPFGTGVALSGSAVVSAASFRFVGTAF
jgi:hypothetical protein